MLLDSGHEATLLEGEELAQQQKDFTSYKDGLARLSPGGWLLTKKFTKFANDLYHFEWRSSDVVVMTYPKCGTTWTQEIIWTMRNNTNFDHPYSNDPLKDRSPFIEYDMFLPEGLTRDNPLVARGAPSFLRLYPDADPNDGVYIKTSAATPDPRTIKTHLPFSLFHPSLLDKAKVVYVARNPKDVLVSYCHHSRILFEHGFQGTLVDFYKYFIDGNVLLGPYDAHVKEAWERRTHPNLHFVFYEDMQADIMKEIRRLNDFMNTQLTEDQLKKGRAATGRRALLQNLWLRWTRGLENALTLASPLSNWLNTLAATDLPAESPSVVSSTEEWREQITVQDWPSSTPCSTSSEIIDDIEHHDTTELEWNDEEFEDTTIIQKPQTNREDTTATQKPRTAKVFRERYM